MNITANTTYVASYHTTSGYYSYDDLFFGSQFNNVPLHALADGPSGGNGVFKVAGSPAFPTDTYRSANFWVDVVLGSAVAPPPVTGTTYTLWNNSTTPVNVNSGDGRAMEVGMKFKSDVAGSVSGVRFYKATQNNGVHNVSLWAADGTLLARALSTGESPSGWQQVSFAAPVNISANATYIVSYHTTSGFYSYNDLFFVNQFNNAPLHGLADVPSGGNGVLKAERLSHVPNGHVPILQLLGRRRLCRPVVLSLQG